MSWSPAERGQAMAALLPCTPAWHRQWGLGSRVRAELGSGSCSSRGALSSFAVAAVTAALVTLSGEQVASVALVTCVSLAPVCVPGPCGTKGSVGPSLTVLGLCRSLWR